MIGWWGVGKLFGSFFSFGDVGGDFGQGDHFYKQIPYTSYLRLILDIECEKLI